MSTVCQQLLNLFCYCLFCFALSIFLFVSTRVVLQSSNHTRARESNAGRESVYIPRAGISPPRLYALLLRDKASLCGTERAYYPNHNKTLMRLVQAGGGTGADNASQTHSGFPKTNTCTCTNLQSLQTLTLFYSITHSHTQTKHHDRH